MSAKDSPDPGWNDPPIFTYDKATAIQSAAASKKGISLNKRIPFPLTSNKQENIQQDSLPIMDSAKPPPTVQSHSVTSESCQNCLQKIQNTKSLPTKVEAIVVGKDKIDEVLNNLQVDVNCDEETLKRIKLMEKMWVEDKLDETVRFKILELSKALANNNADEADHIQKSLMVDYISQCRSWMGGIRYLINKKRNSKS